MKGYLFSRVRLSAIPWTVPTRLLCAWNSPGKNAGVGGHSLLQGIFLTKGLNPGLLHCGLILYRLQQPRKPGSKETNFETGSTVGKIQLGLLVGVPV